MIKALRALGIALLAVLIGVAVGSCGGKDKKDKTTTTRVTVTQATPTVPATPAGAVTPGATGTPVTAVPGVATSTPGATATDTGATDTAAGTTTTVTNADGTLSTQTVPATASAFNPFASTSPWNTPVDVNDVDPNSDELLRQAALRIGVQDTGLNTTVQTTVRRADTRLFVNSVKWTDPVVDETGGSAVRIVCRQIICGPDANVTQLIIPPNDFPDPRFDGWYTVINRSQGVAYDLWRARRIGDVISYQYIKKWDLNGPGFSRPVSVDPNNAVSARGSGLPLFAGLILPEELQAGQINHALAISLPGPAQRNYVQPASVTDGIGRTGSLPEGARIRLRSDVELGRLPGGVSRRTANAILTALKRYGAIVVDRSRVPTLYARKNFNYGKLLFGNEVQTVRLEDFEVVKLGPLLQDPPLSSAFINPSAPGTVGSGQGTAGTASTPASAPTSTTSTSTTSTTSSSAATGGSAPAPSS